MPGLSQPPKKRDPEKNRINQKLYRQRKYVALNGLEDVKALHRRRYYERMARMKANGEYEAFKAKKTQEGMRRYHAMSEEKWSEVRRKNAQMQKKWMQKMKDEGTYEAYKQRLNVRRLELQAEKKRALGVEGWKALQKQKYEKRVGTVRPQHWQWLDEQLDRPFPLPWLPLDWADSEPEEEDTVQTLRAVALQQMDQYLSRIPRLTAFLIDSTRSLGVSHGSAPYVSEKGNSCANSALLGWGVNLSFFLALGVMFGLGGTGGFLGPPGVDPCFIPWVALTNCVNHACIGPASKSSSPGVVAPVALTPPAGAPNGWRTFLVQWRN